MEKRRKINITYNDHPDVFVEELFSLTGTADHFVTFVAFDGSFHFTPFRFTIQIIQLIQQLVEVLSKLKTYTKKAKNVNLWYFYGDKLTCTFIKREHFHHKRCILVKYPWNRLDYLVPLFHLISRGVFIV